MEAANTLQGVGACCGGTVVTVTLLAVALALLYWYSIAPFSQLDRLGIRHPKPIPFLGNLPFFKQGFWEGDRALVKAYGPICGYYMGRRMMIVVSDPDAIKQILQDDFNIFRNRTSSSLLPKMMRHSLLFLRDERWKQIRSTLIPTFSSATLNEMYPLINQACDVLVEKLKSCADSGEGCDLHRTLMKSAADRLFTTVLLQMHYFELVGTVNLLQLEDGLVNSHLQIRAALKLVNQYYGGLTLDIVASMAFGRIVDSEQNPDEPLIKQVQMFLGSFTPAKPILILAVAFPSLLGFFLRLLPNKKQEQVNGFFGSLLSDLVAARDQQAEKERRCDLLQLVLNTRGTSPNIPVEHFDIINQEDLPVLQRGASPEKTTSMNQDEILGQTMVFIVAGYETTRSLLTFTSYLLATNPECQEKLLREVDALTDGKTPPDHATVQRLPYLDMVISEALRMFPPAFRFARETSKDCTVAGQHIPAGAVVEIPVGCLHHNPEYWPEPEKFEPERFTAEAKKTRHPFVYLPFGAGPRCCIGVRLALLQTKITLVRVLQKYRLESCPQTQIPLQLNTLAIVGPKDGMYVKIVPR